MRRQLGAGVLFAILAVAGAELRGRSLVGDTAGLALATSLALGLAVAAVTLLATTRALRSRRPRLREWVEQLGGSVDPSGGVAVAVGAAAVAAVSEELFFRGLLLSWVGVLASSLLFGAVHLIGGGKARWIWALAATLLGLALGEIAELTGSLAGPLLAHALVNVVNVPRVRAAYARGRPEPRLRSDGEAAESRSAASCAQNPDRSAVKKAHSRQIRPRKSWYAPVPLHSFRNAPQK